MAPHTDAGQSSDAPIVSDNSCSTFLLRARMISPTRLPKGMGYASNMPKKHIHFDFLYGGDSTETSSCW